MDVFYDRRRSPGLHIVGGHKLWLRAVALALRGPLLQKQAVWENAQGGFAHARNARSRSQNLRR